MLFSYRWIADLVAVELGIAAAREIATRLTGAGLAVEMVEERDGDVLLDVDVTTNRPDCMCHLGLAREIAALTGALLLPPAAAVERSGRAAEATAAVHIDDPDGCRRFTASVIRGVAVGPSPQWLVQRLEAIGARPINNVVDVTNYVMWETGQPLHAFDLAKIPGGSSDGRAELRIRQAAAGETLVTLDGEPRELGPGMLVVADRERPVAIAGVMGGLESEVTEATTDILLEVAHFDPKTVRRTAAALGMHTDASHRFERGADPEAPLVAAERAAALIAEIAGGTVAPGAVDARGNTPEGWPPRGRLELGRLVRFAGIDVAAADVERWLGGLGFELTAIADREAGGSAPAWQVTVPSWRYYDFAPGRPDGGVWEADLFEEVLRLHGFDAIPSVLLDLGGSDGPRTPEQERRERIHRHLVACGFAEAINFAFLSREADAELPALAQLLGHGAEALALANPISERYGVLRRSLLPNLVANAGFNRRRGAEAVRLFEIGHVFFARPAGERAAQDDRPLAEFETVALIAGGGAGTPWDRLCEPDLFAFKGVVETLGAALGTPLSARPARLPGLVEGSAAELVTAEGLVAGFFGLVDPAVSEGPGDGFDLFAAELVTDRLGIGSPHGGVAVEMPSRFPAVAADLTLTHAADLAWAEIAGAVEAARPEHLADFGLKDRYDGEGVPDGAVNTTLYFSYGSDRRSLTHDEVNDSQQALAARLVERFGWEESG